MRTLILCALVALASAASVVTVAAVFSGEPDAWAETGLTVRLELTPAELREHVLAMLEETPDEVVRRGGKLLGWELSPAELRAFAATLPPAHLVLAMEELEWRGPGRTCLGCGAQRGQIVEFSTFRHHRPGCAVELAIEGGPRMLPDGAWEPSGLRGGPYHAIPREEWGPKYERWYRANVED